MGYDETAIEPPAGITVEEEGDVLSITCSWFSFWAIGTVFACIVIGSILCFVISEVGISLSLENILVLLVPSIAIVYYTLAELFNRTVITLTPEEITVRHGPLPWWGNRRLRTRSVLALNHHRVEHYVSIDYLPIQVDKHHLYAILSGGDHVRLLPRLYQAGKPRFVKGLIEERLGIADGKSP